MIHEGAPILPRKRAPAKGDAQERQNGVLFVLPFWALFRPASRSFIAAGKLVRDRDPRPDELRPETRDWSPPGCADRGSPRSFSPHVMQPSVFWWRGSVNIEPGGQEKPLTQQASVYGNPA